MRKRRSWKGDDQKPRRPIPSYLFFMQDEINVLKSGENEKKIGKDVRAEIRKKWSELPDEIKQSYLEKGKKSSEEYQTKLRELPPPILSDKDNVQTRCSPERVARFLRGMNEKQVAAIEEIGFGSLLSLKQVNKHVLCRDILTELIERFDVDRECLMVHGAEFFLSELDVEQMLGLSAQGTNIHCTNSVHGEGKNLAVPDLEKELSDLKDGSDDFKRKFVLYALGAFLCPTTSLCVSSCFISCVSDTNKIKNMNWARLVYENFVDGVRKYKERKNSKSKGCGYISGCMLFLKLVYFEHISIDRPSSSPRNWSGPPLGYWGEKEFKEMKTKIDNLGGFDSLKVHIVERSFESFDTELIDADSIDDRDSTMSKRLREIEDDIKAIKDDIKGLAGKLDNSFRILKDEIIAEIHNAIH